MSDTVEALLGYVHFLREREGVRQVRLTRTAREGLAKLIAARGSTDSVSPPPVDGSRRTPGGGSVALSPGQGSRRSPNDGPVVPSPSGGPDNLLSGSRSASGATGGLPRPAISAAGTAAATNLAEPPLAITGSTKIEQLAHLNERAQACQNARTSSRGAPPSSSASAIPRRGSCSSARRRARTRTGRASPSSAAPASSSPR
ncbi:MAG: hypothetical protein WDO13_03625 [Verrucomicrobiota bacterium]